MIELQKILKLKDLYFVLVWYNVSYFIKLQSLYVALYHSIENQAIFIGERHQETGCTEAIAVFQVKKKHELFKIYKNDL